MLLNNTTLLGTFLKNNDAGASSFNGSNGDRVRKFFVNQTVVDNTGNLNLTAMEMSWLRAKGATGATLSDLWDSYLRNKGFNTGTIGDRQRAWLNTGTP